MRKKTCLKILELSLQIWDVNRTKFCLQQKPWKFFIWPVLGNHCWPRFASQDWFSGSPTDFSSGLNSGSENFEPRIKKQQDFFESAFFEKRGQQILAKVGRTNITRKYPDKIRLCLKRRILKKYWPKHYNLFLKPF